eukprot:jgi/Mesvir1/23578/Mv18271-RA.1
MPSQQPSSWRHPSTPELAESVVAAREADWRNGSLVYHVIVDRFAPSDNLEAKTSLYAAPRVLRGWNEVPKKGQYLPEERVWSHEIEFWGGDLQSLAAKLDYLQALGVEVLYMCPIHEAFTNHKYDALDYFAVSREYGTREDVRWLADACHARGMKLVLDGVFNHMGARSQAFQHAVANPGSPWREWFYLGEQYKLGYRAWYNAANLPEVNIDSEAVQKRIYGDEDSVVQGYLRKEGIDGWRLDVAFELGFDVLRQLTEAAHAAKPGSLVTGEIWNYPEEWFPSLDSVKNFYLREVILSLCRGTVTGDHAARMLQRMVDDAGLDPILKSWIILDNHDTPRVRTALPQLWQERMAQVLQFTLPGCPCVYYGVEVGMQGGDDPEMRGPMRWDLVEHAQKILSDGKVPSTHVDSPESDPVADFAWMHKLLRMRRANRALRVGDFRILDGGGPLLAFMRRTDRVTDTVVVIVNSTDKAVTELLPMRDSRLMHNMVLADLLLDTEAGGNADAAVSETVAPPVAVRMGPGLLRVTVPPHSVKVLKPVRAANGPYEYDMYKRVP